MNEFLPTDRQTLREYILDTLLPEDRDRVEALILESSEWQEAFEAERAALAVLDELLDESPPDNLVNRTLSKIDAAEEEEAPKGWTLSNWGSLAATFAIVGILGWILLPALEHSREASRRASTQNNMKQIGLVLKMYANESPGEMYPPMSPFKGLWMFDLERAYPEYLTDMSVLVDLARPDADEILDEMSELATQEPKDWERITQLAALSFTYVGWSITAKEDAELIASSYAQLTPDQLHSNLGEGETTVYRLREGIERFLITDINNPAASARGQSEIPTLISNTPEEGGGINALYMDGHVDYQRVDNAPSALKWLLDALPHILRPD
jgi:prepilin-type processing-associated H-X9-DG protein